MCGDCCCCEGEKKHENLARKNVCCTDIVFLILFTAFWGGMVYIAAYTFQRGDAYRLVYGYDSYGNTCNKDNAGNEAENLTAWGGADMSGKKKVFFFDVVDPFKSHEICIKECPKEFLNTKKEVADFAKNTDSRLCRYDIDPNDYESLPDTAWGEYGPCPKLPVFPSFSLLSRCMPDPLKVVGNITDAEKDSIISFLNGEDMLQQVLADLFASWKELIYLCLIALGISFLMVLLIRYVAAILVWVIVVFAAIGSLVGTGILWWTWYELKFTKKYESAQWEIPILRIDVKNQEFFLGFSIAATVLTFFLLLVILVMRKRLALVVALFHEAGKAVANMPLLLIQPLWTFIVFMVFLVYWLGVLAFIQTTDTAYLDENNAVAYNKSSMVDYFFWYHVVGLIWTSEFILACQQFVIAGAVSLWFFTRNKEGMSCTVGQSTCRLILHHIGTVAFGAFIITLVKIPRYILMYIHEKCDGSENICAKACLKCCICCLWCLEKLLKFLNQNAYTITAIEGKSFCPAAKRAFGIIASNVLRVAAINSVGSFVLFLGKIGVMAATCAISVIWLKSNEELHFFAIPVLLVSIFAYLIADCFFTVYEMVIDTLLLCFCCDSEINDGSEEKPYYMSNSLMKFVEDSSKALNYEVVKDKKVEMSLMKGEQPAPTHV